MSGSSTKATTTNPKDLFGIKKVPLHLVPPSSIAYQAMAMKDGAQKYGPYNWREKDVKASIYVAAALRHIMAWHEGEENAPDSGLPHLGHALACLGIIVDAGTTGNLVDDRPKAGAFPQQLVRFNEKPPAPEGEPGAPIPSHNHECHYRIPGQGSMSCVCRCKWTFSPSTGWVPPIP